MRVSRHRQYGHPRLIGFIEDLASQVADIYHTNLLIGDLGQARGGPTPSGHRSHQTGLDVDIWFLLDDRQNSLLLNEREGWQAPSMLNANGTTLDNVQWSLRHEAILMLAAQHPLVERIFVNPLIKQALCQHSASKDRVWLRKIRPWWKHDDHFHVRLYCDSRDMYCQSQEPVADDEGCTNELNWWLSPTKPSQTSKQAAPVLKLPALCDTVLNQ